MFRLKSCSGCTIVEIIIPSNYYAITTAIFQFKTCLFTDHIFFHSLYKYGAINRTCTEANSCCKVINICNGPSGSFMLRPVYLFYCVLSAESLPRNTGSFLSRLSSTVAINIFEHIIVIEFCKLMYNLCNVAFAGIQDITIV